jgi:hypothetical protein
MMMRFRRFLVTSAAIGFLATPGAAQRAGAPKLGVDGLVLFRDPGSVAVLARATSYWQAVSTRSEELLGDFRYLPEYATARARGQVFEILETDAPGWMGSARSRFVAVPWSFGPGCAEEGWLAPEWVIPGDTVTFLLIPTRSGSGKGDGRPVFDVLGWQQPYPVGELIPFWRKGPQKNPVWLTAQEFFELLTLLPSELAFRDEPEGALSSALDWMGRRPGRESAFPVPEILGEWEKRGRELGEAKRGSGSSPWPSGG